MQAITTGRNGAAAKMSTSADTAMLKLEIAELTCLMRFADAAFAARLDTIYEGFHSASEPQIVVEVSVDPTLSGRKPRPVRTMMTDGSFEIVSYNFEGVVSLRDGRAAVGVSPEWEAFDAFLRILYSLLLPTEGGVLVHASAVVHEGAGCIFAALPEGGKSTVVRLSGDRHIIGDELVALRCVNGHVRAYTTPFWNEPELARSGSPTDVPVGGLFLLQQDDRTYVERVRPLAAAIDMLPHLFYEPEQLLPSQAALEVLGDVVQATPCRRLHFTLDQDQLWRCLENGR